MTCSLGHLSPRHLADMVSWGQKCRGVDVVKRKAIRFSPVELALVVLMGGLLLLNLWQSRLMTREQHAA